MHESPSSRRWFFLDDRETALVAGALSLLDEADAAQAAIVRDHLTRLGHAADIIRESPSIAKPWHGDDARTHESLVDLLCRVPDYDLDLHIPTKAIFGQAYLVAKVNFFKAVGYTLAKISAPEALLDDADRELSQSIYSKLAEELFVSIVTDPAGRRDVKASAARSLFVIWEDRLEAEIDDFAPVLESVWAAKRRLKPVLGALRGTQEYFRLLDEACDTRFLDYYSRGDVPEEELWAFEEFLFGLSFEEIGRLRAHLDATSRAVVSTDEARGVLGRSKESWAPSGGAQALYSSYKKRRLNTHYRALTGAPGPKKTAEEYVMIAFLLASAEVP